VRSFSLFHKPALVLEISNVSHDRDPAVCLYWMFAVEWLVVDDGGDQICDESSICSLHREMIVVRRSRETRGREMFVVRRSCETKGRETESWDKVFWSLCTIQNSLHREMVVVRRSRETKGREMFVVRRSRETRGRETESRDKESHVWSLCTIQNVCYDYWVLRHLCILDVVGLCSADWDGLIRCYDGCETWLCCLLLLKKNPMVGSY
jgi:hypothetical protein